MNKELFVSATPHETKVGITEDDQLAEIYLERENEYTLAGSIYKGRVTRVLPGMQSAFVDIGLERDAFLYVSDFMDLEQQDEDLDEAIPANRPVTDRSPEVRPHDARQNYDLEVQSPAQPPTPEFGNATTAEETEATAAEASGAYPSTTRDFRGRRRRRGRRGENSDRGRGETRPENRETGSESPRGDTRGGRGERFGRSADSRFQRAASAYAGRDYDYGPPPGYQPIVLPGESISKYQRQGLSRTDAAASPPSVLSPEQIAPDAASILDNFPEDEPMFAAGAAEPLHEQHEHVPHAEANEAEVNEAGEFRAPVAEPVIEEIESRVRTTREAESLMAVAHEADFLAVPQVAQRVMEKLNIEEQEIEEEEAELTSYGQEPGDDDDFEELEEETHAAGGEFSRSQVEASASAQPGTAEHPASGDIAPEAVVRAQTEIAPGESPSEAQVEAEEREAEELELEEAQAEAEALLEAEAIGEGTVDASAEVRGPASEAMLLQRAPRRDRGSDWDRRRGRRGGRRFRSRENRVVLQISELLKEGQEILIQIAKEPIAKKGARITSHIALPGRFLVFMPTVNHTGVSRKISSEEERQRLKRIIQSERENGGGFIVRTAAAGATDEELRADIRFLKNLWNEIKSRSDSSKSPALIYHDLNVVERVLRDQVSSDFSVIWVDTELEYERIVRFANRFQPALVKRVKLYTKETPLFDQFGLNEEINKALKSKVWLKSGGYIVINQTEALVAIDVNTGKYVGKTARLEDTIVKTNVDAIREIVRQVRLRDLGGIIIIDFIDMDERRNRQKVMQALEEALRADRAPSKVLQFNDFGLVAITRKRVKQSLERTIGSPCPYCQSTGFVKSVSTICNEVYVEMRKIANHLEHSDVMLRVNPEVAKALKANNARLLNEMEELTKKTVIVKSDPALHQEQFDIH